VILFWLRWYMTYEVLGYFYDLDKTNIENNLKDVLATLDTMTAFTFKWPSADRVNLDPPQAVMTAFPDVRPVIDAKEQRVQRPKNTKDGDGHTQDNQKPNYSGKKKAHTVKTQLAVRPDGLIEDLSDSAPGAGLHTTSRSCVRQTSFKN
jgi:hypothetical protein